MKTNIYKDKHGALWRIVCDDVIGHGENTLLGLKLCNDDKERIAGFFSPLWLSQNLTIVPPHELVHYTHLKHIGKV